MRNHFSAIGRSAAIRNRSVTSGSKPYSSTVVVAGQAAAQEREELGEPRLPVVAEDLAWRRAGRPPASRAAGMPAGGPRSVAWSAAASAAGGASAARPSRRPPGLRRRAPASGAGRASAVGCRGSRRRRRRGCARPARPAAASAPGCARPRTAGSPVPRPGRPRVPIGMISASPTAGSRGQAPTGAARSAHAVGARSPDGRARGAGEVGERLGRGELRLEAEHRRASGWCPRRDRRSGSRAARARSRRRGPSAAPSRRRPTAKPAAATDGRRGGVRPGESIMTPSPATLKVPGTSVIDGVRAARRAGRPRGGTAAAGRSRAPVGITGSRKYAVIGLITWGPTTLASRSIVTATSGRRRAKPRT